MQISPSPARYHAAICTEGQNPEAVDAFLQLRKRIFVDQYGWDLKVTDGRERDQFDTANAVYSLLFRDDALVGGFRAIRTDHDYLARCVFPQLAAVRSFPQRRDYWEISRFGILAGGNRREVAKYNYALMLRFGQMHQAVALVALVDLTYERFLTTLGIRTRRYGPPQAIGSDRHGNPLHALAGEIPLNEQGDPRFHALLDLAKQVEIDDAAYVFGRSRISA
jgi:N-acyl-L-homoserine lactone synthetase